MLGQQPQKTSVYSEYQNNENSSITSPQLEYWLKQIHIHPIKPPAEWTLMSTNSLYQHEQHSLRRNQTFQTLKQNDSMAFNSSKAPNSSLKSKSYIKAMTQLQAKTKKLENQNEMLKSTVKGLREQKFKSMNQSSHMTEQLRQRISALQPKTKKLQQLVRENKQLRDGRQETNRRIKLLDKQYKEAENVIVRLQQQLKIVISQQQQTTKRSLDIDKDKIELNHKIQLLNQDKNRLQQRNKQLQQMKDKSTTSVIQKYNKALEQIEELTAHNNKLRSTNQQLMEESSNSKRDYADQLGSLKQRHQAEKHELMNQIQRLKIENNEKDKTNSSLNQQVEYYRTQFKSTNQALLKHLHDSQIINQAYNSTNAQNLQHPNSIQHKNKQSAQMNSSVPLQIPIVQSQQVSKRSQELIQEIKDQSMENKLEMYESYEKQDDPDIGRISIIKHNILQADLIQSQLQFQPTQEDQPQMEYHYQTRSVGKSRGRQRQSQKPYIVQNQTHSQHNYHTPIVPVPPRKQNRKQLQQKNHKKSKIQKQVVNQEIFQMPVQRSRSIEKELVKSKEKSKSRSKQKQDLKNRSIDKQKSKSGSHERSRLKEKKSKPQKSDAQIYQINDKNSENQSFVLRTHQPRVYNQHPQYIYTQEPIAYSASAVPYYYEPKQVTQFGLPESLLQQQINFDKALLNQLQRETVRLIQEQERLIQLSSQTLPSNDRSENIGRLKQVSEQMRVNTEKIVELKQKINSRQ